MIVRKSSSLIHKTTSGMGSALKEKIYDNRELKITRKTDGTGLKYQPLAASFLRTLIYFDIFSYPLTRQEIFEYSSLKNFDLQEGINTLENLLEQRIINNHLGYYFIGNASEKIKQRIAGNKLAKKRMKNARFFSAVIASFPFTRGVYISGSLSKGYMDENSDIDYFILTSPNRLWLCRTLLILFKKIFLFNSHKNFCINYLIDIDHLEIKERNIYTATEVALLLPMYNIQLFEKFLKENIWVKEYYPNLKHHETLSVKGLPGVKKIAEKLLDNRLGDKLDNFFFKTTSHYWERKHRKIDVARPESELVWNKHVSQYNPRYFRLNVLNRFRKKILEFESLNGLVVGE
jgi:hypothetical protein